MGTHGISRFVFAALIALAATGCFVFDEIDSAGTFKKANVPDAAPAAKSAGAAEPGARAKSGAPAASAAAKPATPKGDAWWKTASSVTSEAGDDSITRCAIDGRTEFSKRDECIARGGKPQ